MPFANFLEFGAGVCEVAGIVFPELQPDANGVLAFHLKWQDVVMDFMQRPEQAGIASMSINFGSIPDELELDALRALVEANLAMFGPDGPVFCKYPGSRQVVLQKILQLSDIDGVSMVQMLDRAANIARNWRADPTFANFGIEPANGQKVAHSIRV